MAQLLTMNRSGSETIQWVTAALMQAGLQVSQSFDLRSVLWVCIKTRDDHGT